LHQPKRPRTRAQQPRATTPRKRKPKAAKSESAESLIPVEFLSQDSAPVESSPAPAPSETPPASGKPPAREIRQAGWSIYSVVLPGAAFTLAAVGVTMNGWFARSLGSSDTAGWLFMAIGVAADLAALVTPICAVRLWHIGHRAASLAGWLV